MAAINTNLGAMGSLLEAQAAHRERNLDLTLNRLSTGLRITRARDGLSITSRSDAILRTGLNGALDRGGEDTSAIIGDRLRALMQRDSGVQTLRRDGLSMPENVIRDVELADATAELNKALIQQQADAASLEIANAHPDDVLSLLSD